MQWWIVWFALFMMMFWFNLGQLGAIILSAWEVHGDNKEEVRKHLKSCEKMMLMGPLCLVTIKRVLRVYRESGSI